MINIYTVFQALWDEAKDIVKDSETRSRLIGVQTIMGTFVYFFGLFLGERNLKHTDNLIKTFQDPYLIAFEGQADLTCQTLLHIRRDEELDLFWKNVMLLKVQNAGNVPLLQRKRKMAAIYEMGLSESSL